MNLLATFQIAIAGTGRNLGVLVVLNDEIHAAQLVRKTHTSSPSTFSSAPLGPIGLMAEGEARILMRPPILPTLSLDETITEASVRRGITRV